MFIPTKEQAESVRREYGTPTFLTSANQIRQNATNLLEAFADLNMKIFYAVKANYNPAMVKVVKEAGIYGIDAVSINEIKHVLSLGYTAEQITYTPSNPSTDEIREAGELGVLQNLGSISEVQRYCELFPESAVSVRICPEVGAGEFKQVTTGDETSKFGVSIADLDQVAEICEQASVRVVGIHSHIGSGFYEPTAFKHSVEAVLGVARRFASIEHVDFGGGFGVQYHPEKEEIDLAAFAAAITEPVARYEAEVGNALELRIEPGKYLVSNATVLLAEVTTVKSKSEVTFVGLNTGFNHLIRPAMYDAYHHIVNATNPDAPGRWVEVVGNVCETCDVFNGGIEVADPTEGDILAILVAGGYCSAMSSNYNMREACAEAMLDGSEITLTRKRQTLEDITAQFV